MKPATPEAMRQLIRQIREAMPFDAPEADLCSGHCHGCSFKLLEYLDIRLEEWEDRLARGEQPTLGDLHRLARTGKKIYRALEKNGLVEARPDLSRE
ncbi:MAG TPA: hypothetical protein ENK26_15310 [Gammaproteobacteria bacterium]|nr:hypothetical protein [Gammaproteobacteria bacterium]